MKNRYWLGALAAVLSTAVGTARADTVTVQDFRAGHVATVTCDPTTPKMINYSACYVPDGYVLIGGGAEVIGEGEVPGTVLTGAYPDEGLAKWNARSRSWGFAPVHQMRAFAIGIRFDNTSDATLRQEMTIVKRTSAISHSPSVTARLPMGYVALGGGARANSAGAGQLLNASEPIQSYGWQASSSDFNDGDPDTVTAWVIGIRSSFLSNHGWSLGLLSQAACVSLGGAVQADTPGTGSLRLSIGGAAQGPQLGVDGGAPLPGAIGRFLTALRPSPSQNPFLSAPGWARTIELSPNPILSTPGCVRAWLHELRWLLQ